MAFDLRQSTKLYFPGIEMWINSHFYSPTVEKIIKNVPKDADYYFNEKIIKHDVATTIAEVTIGQKNIIIKRINPQNIFAILRRLVGIPRVERNWKYAALLGQHNIATFTPVALVKKKYFGVCYKSYLYMSKIDGPEAVVFLDACTHKEQWLGIADKIIALIEKLNQLGLRHRDLNLSNIIVYQEKPYLVDLDAMKLEKRAKKNACQKEIDRFMENIEYLKQKNNEMYTYFYHRLIKEKSKQYETTI